MKPLIVLLSIFAIAALIFRFTKGTFKPANSGRIAISGMLLFTAIGHFAFPKGMAMMVPDFIPMKLEMVYLTGILEILFAIGLCIPKYRVFTAWTLILFLVLMLPANIKASVENINYQTGLLDGKGTAYLWFRIPLQILFVLWTYLSAIRQKPEIGT